MTKIVMFVFLLICFLAVGAAFWMSMGLVAFLYWTGIFSGVVAWAALWTA